MSQKFQEESSDLETQLLELGFLCEKDDGAWQIAENYGFYAAHISRWVSTWKLMNFAYETHPKAYIDAGLFDLPKSDWCEIVKTPDVNDIITIRGIVQVFRVGKQFVFERGLSK